jgi:hypothetical protein
MIDIADDIEVKEENTGSEAEALADILAWSKDCPEWQRAPRRRGERHRDEPDHHQER